ncbi:TonB-dependent receptor [Desulfatitalea tepidiphila]|uniref:TonB-dependent receptor n=1 Tax=Desulfatitalea tepidiphila TaxID=1185843 RepID=UPI0006B4ACA3|nr:TonB-dependent receptor [Desulfatitalea tepidiphila]
MHGVMKVVAAALILTGGAWGSVQAEQTESQETKVAMEEVVVTASREAEPTAKVPAHVTVIDAETIARSNAKNVPEVLSSAGLHVSDIGGNQRAYIVDLRGFGEVAQQNLLVMVDGRRINQADLSGTDWTLIPLDRIERIEVLPGSRGTILYGDNATGGVINIITKTGTGLEGRVAAQYGSYETYKGSAGFSGAKDIWSFDMSATYLDSDGYRDNSQTEAKDVGATLRIDPSESVSIDLSGGYHKDETGLPGALLQTDIDAGAEPTDTVHPDDFADTEDYYAKSGLELFFLTNDAFRLDLSYRKRSVDQYASFFGGYFNGDTRIETIAVSPRFTFQEDFGEVSNRLIMGGDFSWFEEDIDNFSSFTGASSYELKRENIGYFVQDDLDVTRHLTLSGGYRYERADYSFSSGSQDDKKFDEESWTVGINYAFGIAKAYASYGTSFRYPVLDEIFNFIDNSAATGLKPQKSNNIEVGAMFGLIDGMTFAVNIFRLETEDEIFYNPAGGPFGFGANENLDGDTVRQGIEVRWDYAYKGWLAGAAYTHMKTEIDGGAYDSSAIPNVPENRISANLGYAFDMGLFLGVDGIYTGSRYLISDFNNAFSKQDDYTVVNAKIKYDWRWLGFFVNFNNIFDEDYASYGGLNWANIPGYYPSPEFNVLAGVTARFGSI